MGRPRPGVDRELQAVLVEARAAGFLGPGVVEDHVAHALDQLGVVEDVLGHAPRAFADLGTGGGLPGLVAVRRWPAARGLLIEAGKRRARWLRAVVGAWAVGDRIEVYESRAEVAGRDVGLRGTFEAVTARGFSRPAIVAECGAPLLAAGGWLCVSEPPGGDARRWPAEGLAKLGLGAVELVRGRHTFACIRRVGEVDDRWPRRPGIPAKRPLW